MVLPPPAAHAQRSCPPSPPSISKSQASSRPVATSTPSFRSTTQVPQTFTRTLTIHSTAASIASSPKRSAQGYSSPSPTSRPEFKSVSQPETTSSSAPHSPAPDTPHTKPPTTYDSTLFYNPETPHIKPTVSNLFWAQHTTTRMSSVSPTAAQTKNLSTLTTQIKRLLALSTGAVPACPTPLDANATVQTWTRLVDAVLKAAEDDDEGVRERAALVGFLMGKGEVVRLWNRLVRGVGSGLPVVEEDGEDDEEGDGEGDEPPPAPSKLAPKEDPPRSQHDTEENSASSRDSSPIIRAKTKTLASASSSDYFHEKSIFNPPRRITRSVSRAFGLRGVGGTGEPSGEWLRKREMHSMLEREKGESERGEVETPTGRRKRARVE